MLAEATPGAAQAVPGQVVFPMLDRFELQPAGFELGLPCLDEAAGIWGVRRERDRLWVAIVAEMEI